MGSFFQSLNFLEQIFLSSILLSVLALFGWILWCVFVDGFPHKGQNANHTGTHPSEMQRIGFKIFIGILGFLMIFGVTSLILTRLVLPRSAWQLVGAVLAGGVMVWILIQLEKKGV